VGAAGCLRGGCRGVRRHAAGGAKPAHWNLEGIAVLRETKGSGRIVALVCLAVVIQIARNWLLLNWSGVDASVFDSTALLIALAVVGLLPVGPSLGAASAVLILGSNGAAAAAAAGALLTATAAAGALCFASWALVDRLRRRTPAPAPAAA
jgi:hypothetical protein